MKTLTMFIEKSSNKAMTDEDNDSDLDSVPRRRNDVSNKQDEDDDGEF